MNIHLKNVHSFIRTHDIGIFLFFAPIISAVFVLGVKLHLIPGRLYLHGRFFLLLFLLIGIIKLTRGNSGIKDLFKPMLIWKIPFRWYAFAFLFASSIAFVTLCLKALYLGGDFSVFKLNFSIFTDIKFTFNMIFFAFIGEVVWVSFAVRHLIKTMNPLFASLIVGLVWALWWTPIALYNVGVIENLPIPALIINMMGAAGICTIVYLHTKSGLCVWILQSMLNASCIIFPVSPGAGIPVYWTFCVVYFLAMLSLMYYFRKLNAINSNKIAELKS